MMSDKYSTIHYQSYLELDKLLGAQNLRSVELGSPAHEEMLFIITHQAYELWFKQIIHELVSIHKMFEEQIVDEKNVGTAVDRLNRIAEILNLAIQQIKVMETMTPLDFLDFRSYLFPASGFQSFQFRQIEAMLGLPVKKRITYNNYHYTSAFSEPQQAELEEIYASGTLFDLVEDWLERTPFIKFGKFDFLKHYESAVNSMISKEQEAIRQSELNDKNKEMRLAMLGNTDTYFQSVLNKDAHAKLREEGKLRLSYDATVASLFISLYRDEPILHMPYLLITSLIEIDEQLTNWRQRHAQMVLRMLGRKIGTGGSSGHDYLSATAAQHHIFNDFHNISTLLIPRSELPQLPSELKDQLSFFFRQKAS